MAGTAEVSYPMTADPLQHRQELIERLDALRRNEKFCDVAVTVKGKEFKAHKLVLAAASPFFLSLLESDMRESNEQSIRIELEEATAAVMEEVLKYIYTGNVLVTDESAHNLIATADYLLMPGLKTAACDFLKKNVTPENCLYNYYFADKYQCTELKESSCEVIKTDFSGVMETDDFLNLDVKQVMEWVSSDDVVVRAEEEIFHGIVKWVSHNRSEREQDFPQLLQQVRLMPISNDFMYNYLVREELVTTNIECTKFVLDSLGSIFGSSGKSLIKPPRKCLEVHQDGIFVCGGRRALCYLPHKNKWYHFVDMTLEHQHHAAIQHRGKVYIFSEQRVVPDESPVAEYYIPSSNSWGAIRTKKSEYEEQFSSVLVLDGHMTLYALTNTETDQENTIYTYHPDKNEWKVCRGGALSRWGACGVTDGHHIYIVGGTEHENEEINGITKVEKLDPSVDRSCEEVAAMNEARHGAFGAAMNGKIYVAGGQQKNGQICTVLKTCEVYNPSTDEWQLIPSLKVPRHSASMVCFKGALYVVGGMKHSKKSRELSVEMFDSDANEWKEKSTIPVNRETQEEVRKKIHYKACVAMIHKEVLVEFKKEEKS